MLLLHGYAQTSHMWRPLMPELAKVHRAVHACDPPADLTASQLVYGYAPWAICERRLARIWERVDSIWSRGKPMSYNNSLEPTQLTGAPSLSVGCGAAQLNR